MRISHRELESCRSDPVGWIRAKANPRNGPRWGYDRAVTVAIYRYHHHGDVADARQYLLELLDRVNLKSPSRVRSAEALLGAYVEWHRQSGVIVAEPRVRIALNLRSGIILGGEVSRVDLDVETGGYRGILLGNADSAWVTQLRMPLLQRALAQRYQRPESDISVGVQLLDGSGLTSRCFPTVRLNEAERSARALAKSLAEMGRKAGLR